MKATFLILYLLPAIYLAGQENKWKSITLDEVLTISLPAGFSQQDTSITANGITVNSRIIQSNTGACILYISVDSSSKLLEVHDTKSAHISLEGIGEGICFQYSQAGYKCERSDTAIEKIPGKKFLIYENKNDLALLGYVFRANNKTYRVFSTVSNNPKECLRPNDLNKLLASVKFNVGNIKEYKFYSKL